MADALNPEQLKKALKGISVAYYLIHSMLIGNKTFTEADILAASNFRIVAEAEKLQRIIYLGAMGESGQALSSHLESRENG